MLSLPSRGQSISVVFGAYQYGRRVQYSSSCSCSLSFSAQYLQVAYSLFSSVQYITSAGDAEAMLSGDFSLHQRVNSLPTLNTGL